MKSKRWFVATLVLISLGFLYSFSLGEQSLWIDEGYSINAAQSIIEKGLPVLDSGAWYVKGIAQAYVMAGSMAVFGFDPQNPWSARLPSVLFGVFAVCFVYLFTKKAFNSELVAFLSAIFFGLFTWQIAWLRQARGFSGMELCLILSFFFLYKWFGDRKQSSLVYTFVALLVSILFHPPSAVLIIPIAGFVMYEVYKHRAFMVLPIVFSTVSIVGLSIFMFKIISLDFIFKFTPSYFIFLKDNLLIPAVLALIGIVLGFFDKEHKKTILTLAVFVIFPLLLFSFYRYSVQGRYLLTILPSLLVLATYSAVRLVQISVAKRFFRFTPYVAILFLFGINFSYLTFYPTSVYLLEQWSPQPNFKEAYGLIEKQRSEKDIVISSYTHLSKIYLGDRGLWLPVNLTRNPGEIERYTINDSDYYTGAPKIHDSEELKETLEKNSGFVVMDRLSKTRLGKKTWEAISLFDPKEIYHSGEVANEIWVYRFE